MIVRRHAAFVAADRPGGQHPHTLVALPDEPWRRDALCAQTDPDAFFPEKGESTAEAKTVCGSCYVQTECLDYAIRHNERYGVWGGLSERERRRIAKGLPAPAKIHGGRALTEAQVDEVCRLYAAGVGSTVLGDMFGVSAHLILTRLRERRVPLRGRGGRPHVRDEAS